MLWSGDETPVVGVVSAKHKFRFIYSRLLSSAMSNRVVLHVSVDVSKQPAASFTLNLKAIGCCERQAPAYQTTWRHIL